MIGSHRTAVGTVPVALPAAQALELFTPEGERRWATGWNPRYPTGEASLSPGTVFETEHDGRVTIWVLLEVDRSAGALGYARVTPGLHAGTVTVRCTDEGPGRSVAEVRYDLTALTDAGLTALHMLAEDQYAAFLGSWAAEIERALAGPRPA